MAVQTTEFVPTEKLPGALLTMLATAQLSEADAAPNATPLAAHRPVSVLTVTVDGQLIDGGWLSTTTTCWVQLALLP